MDDRKSTSGGVFFLGGILVSWPNKRHDYISQSMTKVEYVATKNNCNQVMWMKWMPKDIKIEFTEPIIIYCDKTRIVSMYKNLVLHSKTKNISIKYNVLREKVLEKEIRLEHVSTKEKIANIFTKPLPKDTF